MTGFGEARRQDSRGTIQVEVRAVNNRHLKVSLKLSDSHAQMEPAIEALVRERIRRGTIQLHVRIERPRRPEDYRLNLVALESYRRQLSELPDGGNLALGALLSLPGVVEDRRPSDVDPEQDWPAVAETVTSALERLEASRSAEGRAMATELAALGRSIADQVVAIGDRAPEVVLAYQKRLIERVGILLREQAQAPEPRDVAREVAIMADRVDVSEELVRLRAHLTQYQSILEETESSGRKLEFLVQEMGREINTIGSKAADVEISRCVVESKALLEKIRELVQNVE